MDTEGTYDMGETTQRRNDTTTPRHEERQLLDQDLIFGYNEVTFRGCKGDRT